MLSFAYKRFDGKVPEPGELDGEDRALLAQVEAGFQEVPDLLKACKFRAALGECLALAARPQLLSNCQADEQRQPWTARRPGSRSRKTRRQQRPASTSSCAPSTA